MPWLLAFVAAAAASAPPCDGQASASCAAAETAWLPDPVAEARWAESVPGKHRCTFDVVDAADLTPERFAERYYGQRPLKVVGVPRDGEVARRTERARLLADFGDSLEVETSSYADGVEYVVPRTHV